MRRWREHRRLSQLALAGEAEISTRHLSFVETGRSAPSRDMLLHLAEHLDIPLRERNALLLAAGFAPAYAETPLAAPELGVVRAAVRRVLDGHNPFPAIAVDRAWTMVDANESVALLLEGVASELLEPPANVLRIALHPRGLAPRTLNLAEWRAHLLARVRRQVAETADPALAHLLDEMSAYGAERPQKASSDDEHSHAGDIVVPLRIRSGDRELSFLSTVTVFGTPLDITVSELAIESFFPADDETARVLGVR